MSLCIAPHLEPGDAIESDALGKALLETRSDAELEAWRTAEIAFNKRPAGTQKSVTGFFLKVKP